MKPSPGSSRTASTTWWTALIGVSDWQVRDRRTLTAVVGVVIAWRDPDDMVTVLAKPYVVIPASIIGASRLWVAQKYQRLRNGRPAVG